VGSADEIDLLVVSDSHLSPRAPEAVLNWGAVAQYAVARQPDLVIHVGDLSLDGARDPTELVNARQLLDGLGVPWAAIPGNHDVGDNPGLSGGPLITHERLGPWRTSIGPDFWSMRIDKWTLIGINAQLFGSGLEAEDEQWEWLTEQFSDRASRDLKVLFCHKPVTASENELAVSPEYRFVPSSARQRLRELLREQTCPLVISGHVHQFRLIDDGRRRHVWAPTTWAVLPEFAQSVVGVKRCGVLWLSLSADGTSVADLVEPLGLAQFTLVEDIPDPYLH
jgi:3',5'-cyclic AMP phosphodiesterase CpdA